MVMTILPEPTPRLEPQYLVHLLTGKFSQYISVLIIGKQYDAQTNTGASLSFCKKQILNDWEQLIEKTVYTTYDVQGNQFSCDKYCHQQALQIEGKTFKWISFPCNRCL
jgi:hypothetical protein